MSAIAAHRLARRTVPVVVPFLVLAATGCGGATSGAPAAVASPVAVPLAESVVQVQRAVAKVWPRTGEIWPGVDFRPHVALILDGRDTGWLVSVDRGATPEKVDAARIAAAKAPVPDKDGYAFGTWEGRHLVSVQARALPDFRTGRPEYDRLTDAELLFGVATHELFHDAVQEGGPSGKTWKWPEAEGAADRAADSYPVDPDARLRRTLTLNSLVDAYRDPARRAEKLAAAAYWQHQWEKGAPDEARDFRRLDVSEGTARYFENTAESMAAADPAAFLRDKVYVPEAFYRPADRQSYVIGSAAGTLNTDPQWKRAVQSGTGDTPLSYLLKGVRPAPQTEPADVARAVRTGVHARNAELKPDLQPAVDGYRDTTGPLLLLPADAMTDGTDFPLSGHFSSPDLPAGAQLMRSFTGAFTLKSGGTLRLKDVTLLTGLPGLEEYAVLPLAVVKGQVVQTSGQVKGTGDRVSGAVGVRASDVTGRKALIAQ
ncbi:hypothetical protein ACIO3O_15900 [Streptomyces sp. NPDC087440]|uniref:hypothetical protein n=1 Tax=Streptomyces sp. NPDC087440 TaxID=3365790 RepID=UPI00381CB23E